MSLRAVYLGNKTYSQFMEPEIVVTHTVELSGRGGSFPGHWHVPNEKSARNTITEHLYTTASVRNASAAMCTHFKSLLRHVVYFLVWREMRKSKRRVDRLLVKNGKLFLEENGKRSLSTHNDA